MQLPLLPAVLVAVSFARAAAISERDLFRTPGIRFAKVARRAEPDAEAPHSANGIKAGNFDDSVYVGNITLGTKSFRVQLDTGSSDLWVDHGEQSIESLGGETIPTAPQLRMSYALGVITGTPVFGDVALGEYHSKKQIMLSVTQAANIDGLRKYGIDGMLGLGLDTGALLPTVLNEPADTVHSFLGNIFAQSPDAGSFTTWYLGRGGDGLMTINEMPEPFNTSIQSVPEIDVWKNPIPGELPRWSIEISGIEAAGTDIPLPKSKQIVDKQGTNIAVLDTGASLSFVSRSISDGIYSSVPGATYPSTVGAWLLPCNSEVHVAFTIAGTRYAIDPLDAISQPNEITLEGETKPVSICIGAFVPAPAALQDQLGLDILLGDNFLRNTFTVLHYAKPSVQLLNLTDENEAKKNFAAARNATLKNAAPEADLSDPEVYEKVINALSGPLTTAPTPSGGDNAAPSRYQAALISPVLFAASCLALLYS